MNNKKQKPRRKRPLPPKRTRPVYMVYEAQWLVRLDRPFGVSVMT